MRSPILRSMKALCSSISAASGIRSLKQDPRVESAKQAAVTESLVL